MAGDLSPGIVARLRGICGELPGAVEEEAWTGTRWRVGKRTFAHVLVIADGWPPVYAREAGTDGPATVLMFRSEGDDLDALRSGSPPFFAPVWRSDEVGMVLPAEPDWDEIAELLADSHRLQSPKRARRD